MRPSIRARALALALLTVLLLVTGCTGGGPAPGGGAPGAGQAEAAFPGRVAYIKGGNVFVLAAGQGPVQVTKDGQNLAPAFSADGKWLLFLKKGDNGLAELWAVPAAGGEARPVHQGALVPAVWLAFGWAPTGSRLAYASLDDQNRPGMLWTVDFTDAGPGQPRQVFTTRAGLYSFAWAPDNSRLAVSAGSVRQGSAEPARIEVVPLDGTKSKVLVNWRAILGAVRGQTAQQVAELGGLTWSPDGQWLSFVGLPVDAAQSAEGVPLYLVHTEKATMKNLGFMLAYPQWLQWNARGDRLALISGSGRDVSYGKKLMVFDPEHAEKPVLELTPQGEVDKDPDWAPDGSGVVVSRQAEEQVFAGPNNSQVRQWTPKGAIVVTTGGKPRAVTDGKAGADLAPQFSADGKHVLFLRINDNKPSVWLAAADGSKAKLLVQEVDVPPGYFGELHAAAVLSWTGR